MFFTDEEVELLENALQGTSLQDRRSFFEESLRLRRRHRNLWADTPVARVLTPQEDWTWLRAQAQVQRVGKSIKTALRKRRFDLVELFDARVDTPEGMSPHQFQHFLTSLGLNFTAGDYQTIAQYLTRHGESAISFATFLETFSLQDAVAHSSMATDATGDGALGAIQRSESQDFDHENYWRCGTCTVINENADTECPVCGEAKVRPWACPSCTFSNPSELTNCEICNTPMPGLENMNIAIRCGPDEWSCGECTKTNKNAVFYCDVCGAARPNLAGLRF